MKRSALFTLVLLMSAALAFGQATVTPSGQATTSGVAVPVAPYSPPLLVTPIVHLSTASTLPATNGGAVAAPEPPTAPGIRAEVQYGQPVVYLGVQEPAAEQTTAPATVAGQQPFEMGVTANAGADAASVTAAENDGLNGRTLGEVARELRGQMQNANAKVYTNSDVNAMPNAGGITGTTASNAQQQNPSNGSYPVGENGVIRQNGPAIASPQNPNSNAAPQQPATEQNPQAQPMNQAAPPANNQPPQKPSAGTVPPQQTAAAQAPPNPADQNAAASQSQSQQENSQKTLPKSASLLPLIALVGAGATVAGLMARK